MALNAADSELPCWETRHTGEHAVYVFIENLTLNPPPAPQLAVMLLG